jgi:hypothetical protein
MVWADVAFKTLGGFAMDDDENALNNPLVVEALLSGHVARQALAIRRLMEDTQKDRISLRRLVKDVLLVYSLAVASGSTASVTIEAGPYDLRSTSAGLNSAFFDNGGSGQALTGLVDGT